MNINELQHFQGVGHNIMLSCFGYAYSDIEWACEIEAEHDGTKLKVLGKGATPEEAARAAIVKFDRATVDGVPEMRQALTYEGKATPVDDEVPF